MAGLRATEAEFRALLVDKLQLVDPAEFDRARAMADRLQIPLERALAERGGMPLSFLLDQTAQAWGVGFVELRVSDIEPEALWALREDYARAHLVIPVGRRDRELRLAMVDPRDTVVIREIEQLTRLTVVPLLATEERIRRAHLLYKRDLRRMLGISVLEPSTEVRRPARATSTASAEAPAPTAAARVEVPGGPPQARVLTEAEAASAVDLVTQLLEYAVVAGASDIHVEPYEMELLVRYRIDGVLHEVLSLPLSSQAPVVARLKVLSAMRIDERRLPQDGRFEADLSGCRVDLRVSSGPTRWGEKIVLRVLTPEVGAADLEDLGLGPVDLETLLHAVARPHGMILVTGPTGSGKSTTLYAMLRRLAVDRQNAVNISTIEDPIEYTMPRVTQIPINTSAGLDFAGGLRALLRQDPDVIMVGEIRDRETVDIGVRAALVGRLFLSSLHTNDATTAVPRILDMGIEPFLLASTLVLVMGQRLVRRICVSCRQSRPLDEGTLAALRARPDIADALRVLRAEGVVGAGADALDAVRGFVGSGCAQCKGTGFRGRVALFELFEIDDGIRRMVMESRDGGAIRAAAIARGMKTMFQDGLGKVLLGETTLEEVFRVAV